MSTYNINGLECDFPACSSAQLHQYQPTPRTQYLAWKTLPPTFNVTIIMLLNSMYEMGAMERPPYLIEEGKRYIYLLEHPNRTALETVLQWLHWTDGTNCKHLHPYALARGQAIREADENWRDLHYTKTGYGARPLLDIERHRPELGCRPLPATDENDPNIFNNKQL